MKYLAAMVVLVFALTSGLFATQAIAQQDPGKVLTKTVVITSGGTVSSTSAMANYALVGITFPAAMTGTTVTFKGSTASGGTFVPVYNSSGQVSYTIAASRYYAIDPKDFLGTLYLQVVSGSSEGADRSLVLHLKAVQ